MGQNPNERIPKNRSTPQETVRGVQMGGAPSQLCGNIHAAIYTDCKGRGSANRKVSLHRASSPLP